MSTKIQVTKNYRLFTRSQENRPLDVKKHRKLSESMQRYGFLKCFPIVAFRGQGGQLIVKDGQHRLAIAETLGLPVWWIEEEVDFDVAVINCTSKVWALRDYAQKFAANGKAVYQEGLDFAEANKLSVGMAFALLGGTASFGNVEPAFVSGTFKVKDRAWASAVAGIYGPLTEMSPVLRNARLLAACMAVCRVEGFDAERLLHNATRCREKLLVSYSTREAFLDMLEQVYNFGRAKIFALKIEAIKVMRERNATTKSKKAKAGKVAAIAS